MKQLLLIVDPQNDFINGSLAVAEAEAKMQALASYIATNAERYQAIFVTMDSHPANHCSFADNGGIWPPHCVLHTPGWDTPAYLDEALAQSQAIVLRYYKGTDAAKVNAVPPGQHFMQCTHNAVQKERNVPCATLRQPHRTMKLSAPNRLTNVIRTRASGGRNARFFRALTPPQVPHLLR